MKGDVSLNYVTSLKKRINNKLSMYLYLTENYVEILLPSETKKCTIIF